MSPPLERIAQLAASVKDICSMATSTAKPLQLRGLELELRDSHILQDLFSCEGYLILHRDVQARTRLAVENHLEQLRQLTETAYKNTLVQLRSVQWLGGATDSSVELSVCRVYEKDYESRVLDLRERLMQLMEAQPFRGKQAKEVLPSHVPSTFSQATIDVLEAAFQRSHNLTAREVALVSELSGLSQAQVRVWFQNRRARARKIAEKEKRQQEEGARQDADSSSPTLERRPVAALPKRGGKKGARQPKASTSAPLHDSAEPPAADKPRAVKGLPKRGKKDAQTKAAVTVPSQVPRQVETPRRSLVPARSYSASSDWSATSFSSLDCGLHPASSTAVSDMIPSVASSETAVSSNEAQAMMGPGWNGPMISLPMPSGEPPSFNFVPPTPAKAGFTPWTLPEDFASAYGTGVDLSSFGMPGFDGSHVGQMVQDAAWQETSLEDMFAMLNEYTPQDISAFEAALTLCDSPFYSNVTSSLSPEGHSQAAASPASTTFENQAEDALVHQLIAKWASEPYHLDAPSGPESISGPSSTGGSTTNSRPASFIENAFLPLNFSSFVVPSTDIGEISNEWSVEIPPPNAEGDALLREADEWLRFSPSPSPQPQQLPDSSHSGSPASSMPHTPNSRHAGLMDLNMPGLLIEDGMGVVDPRYIPLPASPKMGPKEVVGEWVAGVLPFDIDEKSGWSLEPVAWTPLQ